MTLPVHALSFSPRLPEIKDSWEQENWRCHLSINIDHFRPESSNHRPLAQAKLCYNKLGIAGIFKVEDRFIVCRYTNYQDPVYKDSCVEFFLKPKTGKGYFNFEFNCLGTLLASYITDPTRIGLSFKEITPLTNEDAKQIKIHATPAADLVQESRLEKRWQVAFYIPFKLLEKYIGTIKPLPGACFTANFYKCADDSSHPHWAAWSEIDQLNFHCPHCFGKLKLT